MRLYKVGFISDVESERVACGYELCRRVSPGGRVLQNGDVMNGVTREVRNAGEPRAGNILGSGCR